MNYFLGPVGGGRSQQLRRTRAQTARNQAGNDRPQTVNDDKATVNDSAAQLARTRGQPARNQGGMQHGVLSLVSALEGIGHVLYHQAPPQENPPLPAGPMSELSTPSF